MRAWCFDAPSSMWLRSSMGRILDRAEMAKNVRGAGKTTLCFCGRTRSEHTRDPEFEGQCTTFRRMTMHVSSTAAPTGAKPREPDVDVTLNAIGRALKLVTEKISFEREVVLERDVRTGKTKTASLEARRLLVDAYVTLATDGFHEKRSAAALASDVRVGGESIPSWCRVRRGPGFRWPAVLAARHGSADPEGDAPRFESVVHRARRLLRRELMKVELDTGAKYLIAPMTSDELADEAWRETPTGERVTIECCRGARVVDGVLQACEAFNVTGPTDAHPSDAWPTCDACGRPIEFKGKKKGKAAA